MALASRLSIVLCLASSPLAALAQGGPAPLQDMVGTWNVEQRMWTGAGAPATPLPPAVAERRLIDGKYLEESMQPRPPMQGGADAFVRHAVLNYNAVNRQYEYFSIDTRAPQAMTYKSPVTTSDPSRDVKLVGGRYLAPEWGTAKNVPFTYRLTVGAVHGDQQTVQLYLTPQAVMPKKEFLAFEYRYVRQP